ncbi:MAG: hypothetical protein ACHQXA_06505, partial [Gemmatimonadales bacterium]
MRVEHALHLLPEGELLGPLRDLVLASADPEDSVAWGGAAPYLTVAKRNVSAEDLRRGLPDLLRRVVDHVSSLYEAYAEALHHQDEGRAVEAV